MFQETTVEMARQAARAIDKFMQHWNDTFGGQVRENGYVARHRAETSR